ncbi:transmembrane protein 171 [Tachyglossus aculeatus]|uniref:transmembrane protein 171 n=1 Tax=Tachyglossus aculeatus TaxID=9261 RepID=UPI0018F4973D|nr:transmembrane protein 171 [Tachyglossus aculeatus]
MSPASGPAEPAEDAEGRRGSKIVFFLLVFGVVLLCTGILLSIFGFQTCQYETLTDCGTMLKIAGPSCAVIGASGIILARSRARLQLRERQRRGSTWDPDSFFICGESRQFAQFLIFGFLFLTSGMLISVLGIWVPSCHPGWHSDQGNQTDSASVESRGCGFLSLQIMGPLIVLIGLCFFVVAHIKKRHNLGPGQDGLENQEQRSQNPEPVQVTVGDAVIIFPPPPPPYFSESSTSSIGSSPVVHRLPLSENPPPYYSIFNYGARFPAIQGAASARARDSVYTISGPDSSSGISATPHPSESPPKYEEKALNADDSSHPSATHPPVSRALLSPPTSLSGGPPQ